MRLRDLQSEHKGILSKIQALNEKEDKAPLGDNEKAELKKLFTEGETLKRRIENKEAARALEIETAKSEVEPWEKEDPKRRFDIGKAALALAGKKPLSGFEREVSDELTGRKLDWPAQGIIVPAKALFGTTLPQKTHRRIVNAESALWSDPIRPDLHLPALREASLLGVLGVDMRSAQGRFTFNKTTGASASYFSGSGGSQASDKISESDPDFESVEVRPSFLGAFSGYSLAQVVNQSGDVNLSALISADLTASMSEKVDETLVKGSGSAGVPRGLVGNGFLSKTTKPHQASVVWKRSELVAENEALVKSYKGNARSSKWLVSAGVQAEWMDTLENAQNGARYLLDNDMAIGKPVMATNHLNPPSPPAPAGSVEVIFGQWNEVMWVNFQSVMISEGQIADDYQRGITRIRGILSHSQLVKREDGLRLMAIDRTA